MIFLELFFSFLKVGFSSFGGLSMVPVINAEMLSHGWMTQEQVIDMLGINYDITALKQTEQELIAAKGLRQAVSEITSIPATDPVIEEIAAATAEVEKRIR